MPCPIPAEGGSDRALLPRLRARRILARGSALLVLAAFPLPAQSREPFAGLDAYIDAALKTWNVPGLGLAIVRNDSLIYGVVRLRF